MDHVNSLPDELLSHILSFLTIKEAALTSILSKRWRDLFAFVPNLDFDDSVFLHPEEGKRQTDGILQSFMDFVDRVLALQGDSLIKKLSLKRGVLDLDFSIDLSKFDFKVVSFLPKEIFVNKTLVELKIRSEGGHLLWPGSEATFLPRLKTLYIRSRLLLLSERLEVFLSAFPMLEEVNMAYFQWKDSDETVSSASLRKLSIYGCGFDDLLNPKTISFDIPSLVFLKYSDFVAEDYPKINLTNLVEAQFNIMVNKDQSSLIRAPDDEDDDFLRFRNVWKLFTGIRNVQKLFLSAITLELLSLCSESIPVFNNLKVLGIIKVVKNRGWQAMPVLLRNCPHLDTLYLEGLLHRVTDKCGDFCDCISREDKGHSLKSSPLKVLHIDGFRGTNRELGMIKHFLESFPSLEEMNIDVEEKVLQSLKSLEGLNLSGR